MRLIGAGILGFLTLAHWFGPYLMRRGLLFGTTVVPDFRDSAEGRGIVRRYQAQTFMWGLAAVMLALFAPDFGHPAVALTVALVLFLVGSSIAFAQANRSSRAHAIPSGGVREVELLRRSSSFAESGTILLLGPAIVAVGFAIAFLLPDSAGQMPLAAGWGAVSARWTEITSFVDKPLSSALGFWFGTLLPLLAFRFGTRRTPAGAANYRRVILSTCVLVNCGAAAFSAWLVNSGALGHAVDSNDLKVAIAVLAVVVIIHFTYIIALRRRENLVLASTGGLAGDRTADQSWLWGIFYHNSDDPALFVEARNGPGYTVNFGHVRAWLLLATIPAAVVLAVVLK